ncbi:MAG: hypothetical protein AAFR61_23450 [Bacteroidota bacterium]
MQMTLFSAFRPNLADLVEAVQLGRVSHLSLDQHAITMLLGGKKDWLDVIDPAKGTIDHAIKVSEPKRFTRGLKQIQKAGFSVEQIIRLEASFSGRVKNEKGRYLATWDEQSDPGANMGTEAVLQMLANWSYKKDSQRRRSISLPKKKEISLA